MITCTLTIKNDSTAEYDDELYYRRSAGAHVSGSLGDSPFTRAVVELLNRWVGEYPYPQCRRDELMVLGRGLYEIAFGSAPPDSPDMPVLQKAFESAYDIARRAGEKLRLRLVLEPAAERLSGYPWEFLYMPRANGLGAFLAGQDTELLLTRWVPNSGEWLTPTQDENDDRLRILVVRSTPDMPGWTQLPKPEFLSDLLQGDSRFQVKPLDWPTRTSLRHEVADFRPHIVHFFGHGQPNGLALCKDVEILEQERQQRLDERNPGPVDESDWVDDVTACGLLGTGLEKEHAPKRLIFLHACEGASTERTRQSLSSFANLARTLITAQRVSGVVAMQYKIEVGDAELFAKSFYKQIIDGLAVDVAAAAARKEFAELPLPGRQSWDNRNFGTPVIYLRREDPLVSRLVHRTKSDDAGQRGADTVSGGKDACPNPFCGALVIRSANPPTCRACHYSFAPCPRQTCRGLVVPKAGYGCTKCSYVYGAPIGDAVASQTAPATRSATTASPSRPGFPPLGDASTRNAPPTDSAPLTDDRSEHSEYFGNNPDQYGSNPPDLGDGRHDAGEDRGDGNPW